MSSTQRQKMFIHESRTAILFVKYWGQTAGLSVLVGRGGHEQHSCTRSSVASTSAAVGHTQYSASTLLLT